MAQLRNALSPRGSLPTQKKSTPKRILHKIVILKQADLQNSVYHPYVGIIQIRLWVETLSLLSACCALAASSPCYEVLPPLYALKQKMQATYTQILNFSTEFSMPLAISVSRRLALAISFMVAVCSSVAADTDSASAATLRLISLILLTAA